MISALQHATMSNLDKNRTRTSLKQSNIFPPFKEQKDTCSFSANPIKPNPRTLGKILEDFATQSEQDLETLGICGKKLCEFCGKNSDVVLGIGLLLWYYFTD